LNSIRNVEAKSKRRACVGEEHGNEAEQVRKQNERSRLSKRKCRAGKTEEELKKLREKDRLRKRVVVASQTLEELKRRREKDRLRKRKSKETEKQNLTLQIETNDSHSGLIGEVGSHMESGIMQHSELWDHVALFAELERQRERSRLRRKKSLTTQTPEEVERRREKDRLRKRKSLACQTPEETAMRREKDRLRKRKVKEFERQLEQELLQQTDLGHSTAILLELEQFERQRERNRLNKRRSLASQTPEQAARRREKDRLRKKRAREVVKQQNSSS